MVSRIQIHSTAHYLRDLADLNEDDVVGDIVSVVEGQGYKFIEEDFGDGFSGFSQALGGGQYLIGFNARNNWNEGFRRFTISHELGHVSLTGHRELLDEEGIHRSTPEYQSSKVIEREADLFAISFLAPKPPARRFAKDVQFTPKGVEKIAKHFGLSFYAAALRLVEVTDLACSLVISDTKGTILFERRSNSLRNSLSHPFLRGSVVGERTVTGDYRLADGRSDETGTVLMSDWYPDLDSDIEADESVVVLGYNGRLLSFVTPWSVDF